MSAEHCVIIGNGPAANEAALTLRKKAPDLKVTMIGRELVRYYRPHLLPDYIAGKIPDHDLYVNPMNFYHDHDIYLRLGQQAAGIDFDRREVLLDHKERVRFDSLIVAVGGKPRIPEPLVPFAHLMLTLKTMADARKWMEKLPRVDSVLIVGGDLTSLAVTKSLISMGKRVSFILCSEAFWPLRMNEEIRREAATRLLEYGVEVLSCRAITRITRIDDHRVEVETDSGGFRPGLVGAFYGLMPDVQFLARSGLDIERGILVDEYLRTRVADVYAAGDCAQVYHPGLKDYWVSIGHANATYLGRIAALNLLGGRVAAEVAPTSIFRVDGINANVSWWLEF
ncbi:MAG: NAD(P)/FAD-dependent oxidoreductase [Desulfomonile tiedjei]|nr:NAD(P)/FAD-dependent oxidoreductase [Desulfomonile tiedjei]